MRVLREAEVHQDPRALALAWDDPAPFCLLPDRCALAGEALRAALDAVPALPRTFAVLTSGSTGEPRLIIGARERAERLARALHEVQQSEPCDEAVVALPLTYSYCLINQWLWARVCGRRLTLTRGFAEALQLRAALRQSRAALLCLVGPQVALLPFLGSETFPGVARLHFAGGAFPQEHLALLRERFPAAQVFNNYGCAEALPRLSLRTAEAGATARDIGAPLPGVELRTGDAGALRFRSDYGALGFVAGGAYRPFESGEWISTGDLGFERADGHWELQGRAGDVFKRYGEKVSLPLVLATVLGAFRGLAASYRQRDRSGEEGYVLVLSPHPDPAQVRAVLLALRAAHRRAFWPLRIESLETLPLLPNGKVDTAALGEAPGRVVRWDQRV